MNEESTRNTKLWAVDVAGSIGHHCTPVTDYPEAVRLSELMQTYGVQAQIIEWPGSAAEFAQALVSGLAEHNASIELDLIKTQRERDTWRQKAVKLKAMFPQSDVPVEDTFALSSLRGVSSQLARSLNDLLVASQSGGARIDPVVHQTARAALLEYQQNRVK